MPHRAPYSAARVTVYPWVIDPDLWGDKPAYARATGPWTYQLGRARPEVELTAWAVADGTRPRDEETRVWLALAATAGARAVAVGLQGVDPEAVALMKACAAVPCSALETISLNGG